MKPNKSQVFRAIRWESLAEQTIKFKLASNSNDGEWVEKRFDLALQQFYEEGAKEFAMTTVVCEGKEYIVQLGLPDGYLDLLNISINLWETIKDPFAILHCNWCFLLEDSSVGDFRDEFVFFLVHQRKVVMECARLRVRDQSALEMFFEPEDNKHYGGIHSKEFRSAQTKTYYRIFSDETKFGNILKIMIKDGVSPIAHNERELLKDPIDPTDYLLKMILFVLVLILLAIVF